VYFRSRGPRSPAFYGLCIGICDVKGEKAEQVVLVERTERYTFDTIQVDNCHNTDSKHTIGFLFDRTIRRAPMYTFVPLTCVDHELNLLKVHLNAGKRYFVHDPEQRFNVIDVEEV